MKISDHVKNLLSWAARNAEMKRDAERGLSMGAIAAKHGISRQRVHQIVSGKKSQ